MTTHPPVRDALQEAHDRVAEAHLNLATVLIGQRSFEDAARHACVAAGHASRDWNHLEPLGVVLFQLGEFFPLAYNMLVQASRNGPLAAEALKMLSALYHRNGETEQARRCISLSARLEPIDRNGA